jgi:hypothetical protein
VNRYRLALAHQVSIEASPPLKSKYQSITLPLTPPYDRAFVQQALFQILTDGGTKITATYLPSSFSTDPSNSSQHNLIY